MSSVRRSALLGILALALSTASGTALAQSFFRVAPAPLSQPHASLDSADKCDKCHELGQGVPNAKCLDCHKDLAIQLIAGRSLHKEFKDNCRGCHREHRGRERDLVDWTPLGGREAFDHRRTGFELSGHHQRLACTACHRKRAESGRPFYLGLSTECSSCHFDEHRGQLGQDCKQCHVTLSFIPAPGFSHSKKYPLLGRHKNVACKGCHPVKEDPEATEAPTQFYLQFKGLVHDSCSDCHRDPHRGRFGPVCMRCHTQGGTSKVEVLESREFHEKARFHLEGAHASAPCKSCHMQPGATKPRYRGLAFEHCSDCHPDAHLGQIVDEQKRGPPDCKQCHDQESFRPPHFEAAQHEKGKFPLNGEHRTVACSLCHKSDPKLAIRIPTDVRRALQQVGRPMRFSLSRFDIPNAERCQTCHADPHAGQFQARVQKEGCTGCHRSSALSQLNFDHARDSHFARDGKHAQVPCTSCHKAPGPQQPVRFKGTPTTCSACHADPHVGQLSRHPDQPAECSRCHTTAGFKPARFDHRPPNTEFLLEGKHAKLACDKCHAAVTVEAGLQIRRFKPMPRSCSGCHADFHHGKFQNFAPQDLQRPPDSDLPLQAGESRCDACHAVSGWKPAQFDHAKTGHPLEGAHVQAECDGCHHGNYQIPVPRSCGACHLDPHGTKLGGNCSACHDHDSWKALFSPEAHDRTNFPLSGRHALIPCEECHLDVRDRNFGRATVDCIGCHQQDRQRAALSTLDHDANAVGTDCAFCHDTWRFSPARFPEHDRCFQLSAGPHAGMRCTSCHTTLVGARALGTCQTNTAACTNCHQHTCDRTDLLHVKVPGYDCKSRKCYECHRFVGSP